MKIYWLAFLFLVGMFSSSSATQSTITEAESYACMGDDKSRRQTEQEALTNAKRKAAEFALTYIKSETTVKDMMLEKDIIKAYANATVQVIEEKEKSWFKDPSAGDCFRVKIKAEVIPDKKIMQLLAQNKAVTEDPSAPLSVQLWASKKEYKQGEKMQIYLRGNKPFYARVVYKNMAGNILQLLPNPYRPSNYFNGGTTYAIPSGEDKFELEVSPPFGAENIIVYASTAQIGDLEIAATSGVYEIKTKASDVGNRTRGVQIKGVAASGAGTAQKIEAAEFAEAEAIIKTTK